MKKILLDTNLLLVLVVGLAGEGMLKRHKKTEGYTEDDLEMLILFLEGYPQVVLTPNIITETSNLISQIGNPYKKEMRVLLGDFIRSRVEVYVESASLVDLPEYPQLGITDSGILAAGKHVDCILTADLDLYLSALGQDLPAENFTHYRFQS